MGDDDLYGKCQKVDRNIDIWWYMFITFPRNSMGTACPSDWEVQTPRPDNLKIYEAHVAWRVRSLAGAMAWGI